LGAEAAIPLPAVGLNPLYGPLKVLIKLTGGVESMKHLLTDLRYDFRRLKSLADRAMRHLDETEFLRRPAAHVNPVALIVKHLAGNLMSRWTDFLATDGEKASRDRDGEFVLTDGDTQANLLTAWERGWAAVFDTLDTLKEPDLDKSVTIRGESHRVSQALLRALSHAAYHTGQILYLVRLWRPESPWLTVPPGQSQKVGGAYLRG
jgi:uncharacterized damage-inducible protein DinB